MFENNRGRTDGEIDEPTDRHDLSMKWGDAPKNMINYLIDSLLSGLEVRRHGPKRRTSGLENADPRAFGPALSWSFASEGNQVVVPMAFDVFSHDMQF